MNLLLPLLRRVTKPKAWIIRVRALITPAVSLCWGIVVRPRMESSWNVAGMTGNSPHPNEHHIEVLRRWGGVSKRYFHISVDKGWE